MTKDRIGQQIGPYRVIEQAGACLNGKPLWLARSDAEKRERLVTEAKLVKIGKKRGFE